MSAILIAPSHTRSGHAARLLMSIGLGLSLAVGLIGHAHAADASTAACCSCHVQAAKIFSAAALPCNFDIPKDWKVMTGDDGASVSAVGGAECHAACPVSGGLSFSVAKKPNNNAETSEQLWRQIMQVAGTARCGDTVVTFFNPPGSDPNGLMGGLKFHVGQNGKKYGAVASFTCPAPGEWLALQRLFIDSFTSNPGSTFPGD